MVVELGDEMADLRRMLEAQEFEKQMNPGEAAVARATRILEEGVTVAAMSIVSLSRIASNENLRFRAATYILDRVLGDAKGGTNAKAPWNDLLDGITIPNDASSLEMGK